MVYRMSFRFRPSLIICLALIICLSSVNAQSSHAQDSALDAVTLQLKWKHQFQFAGYYAAQSQNYYRDAGLDVRIQEPAEGEDPIQTVVDGEAEFGVGTTELVLWRSRGVPVVVLGVIFQHSPLVLIAPASDDVTSLHSLTNQRIGIEPNSAELLAYLQDEGIDLDSLNIETRDFSTDGLIDGSYAAISAYATDEPFILQTLGMDYLTFSPRSAGIDFYGDVLFTTQQQIDEYPERVQAFLDASLQGWRYAFEHEAEMIDLIYNDLSQRHSREHLAFEAAHMQNLVLPDLIAPGYMLEGRWRYIVETYARVGLIPETFAVEQMLYRPNAPPEWAALYPSLLLAAAIAGGSGLIGLRFFRLYRQLKKETEERSAAQRLLQNSESRYRTMVESAPFPVVISSLQDHNVRYMNPRAESFFGVPRDARIGKPAHTVYVNPDDRVRMLEIISRQGYAENFETMLVIPSGQQYWVSISANKVLFEDEPCIFVTFSDLSERRVIEARLRDSEALYRSILHGSPDAISLTDIHWRYTMVSPSWVKMFGYSTQEECLGRSIVDVVGPASYDVAIEDLHYIVEFNEGGRGEYEAKRGDGHLFTIEATTEVIGEKDSPDRKLLFMVRDITDRKRADARTLELAVEQARIRLLAGFIQNASHEFRTPLSIINSSTYLMSKMDDADKRSQQADKVTTQVQLISRLIEMLTQIATLDSGTSLKYSPVELETLLREVLQRLYHAAKAADIILRLDPVNVPPVVYLDPDRFHIALHHLLDNAIRYSLAGSTVTMGATAEANQLCIEVRDSGVGIAGEALPHIFDHFWRQDTAHTTPGLGLGLTLAQKIVLAHGGYIEVESSVGVGSVFRVLLPLQTSDTHAKKEALE